MSILNTYVIGETLTGPPYSEQLQRQANGGFGKQHRHQVTAAMKPATILCVTRQQMRAAERKARKASA